MDSVSQFVLGAFVGEKVLGKELKNKSLFLGGVIATIPDLDYLFTNYFSDSLDKIFIHRGFSHSILFCLIISYFLTFLFRYTLLKKYKDKISFKRLYSFFFLCFSTHILLDCFTVWGTQIFYPLPYRVSFSSIFIIDPFYTLPFIITFCFFLFKKKISLQKRNKLTNSVLLLTSLYLLLGITFKQYLHLKVINALDKAQVNYESINISPTAFNIIFWKVLYKKDNQLFGTHYAFTEKININKFQFISKSSTELPSYFWQHPRSQELISLLNNNYTIKQQGNKYLIEDYRFNFFYDQEEKYFLPIFYYEITNDKFSCLLKTNRHKMTKENAFSFLK